MTDTTTPAPGAELDLALTEALGWRVDPILDLQDGETVISGYALCPTERDDDSAVFISPSTDPLQAFALAMWLVDNRGWAVMPTFDMTTAVVIWIPDVSESEGSMTFGAKVQSDNLDRAEAICRAIYEAAREGK